MTLSVRCTACRAEFTDAEIEGHSSCPKCGSESVPMAIDRDLTVNLNWHELRILCMWASNWAGAKSFGDDRRAQEGRRSLAKIIELLEAQRPDQNWPPLTMAGELQQLANTLGTKVELHQGGHVTEVKPEAKN